MEKIPKEEQKELRRKLFTLIKSLEEETKQETLEEAASRLFPAEWDWKEKESFIEGAQWQQERMYSEEDMAESFIACWTTNVSEGIECKLSFKEWFEQFKKK